MNRVHDIEVVFVEDGAWVVERNDPADGLMGTNIQLFFLTEEHVKAIFYYPSLFDECRTRCSEFYEDRESPFDLHEWAKTADPKEPVS